MPEAPTLDGTLPDLQAAFQNLEDALGAVGVSVRINDWGGFRTAADTATLAAMRQSGEASGPLAPYGQSYHDYGAAVDVSPLAWPSGMTYAEAVQAIADAAPVAGLRQPLPETDPSHLELPISLAQAAAEYNAMVAGGGGTLSEVTSAALAPSALLDVVIIVAIVGGVVILARPARRS